jgi:hypothetical protein
MDIYSYINSPDVAAYCRDIGKTWTPFEMAVIIGRSDRTLLDKLEGWREIISNYPDMATQKNMHFESHESLHKLLEELITYQERALILFKTPEPGAVYDYSVMWYGSERRSQYVFSTFEKACADMRDSWQPDETPHFKVKKLLPDSQGIIQANTDYDGNVHSFDICHYESEEMRKERFGGINLDSNSLMMFEDLFYVDIPLPFKPGDILTIKYNQPGEDDPVFIIKPYSEDYEKLRAKFLSGVFGDGTDMIEWGYFVSDGGVLYGDHTGAFDSFEYYREKLTGRYRLLHYVSLYIKGELGLPELLVMQCRLMMERSIEHSLRIDTHGVYISEPLLAENRPIK